MGCYYKKPFKLDTRPTIDDVMAYDDENHVYYLTVNGWIMAANVDLNDVFKNKSNLIKNFSIENSLELHDKIFQYAYNDPNYNQLEKKQLIEYRLANDPQYRPSIKKLLKMFAKASDISDMDLADYFTGYNGDKNQLTDMSKVKTVPNRFYLILQQELSFVMKQSLFKLADGELYNGY